MDFTTVGFVTIQNPDDSIVTIASPGEYYFPAVGTYCCWISDASGSPSGVTFMKRLGISASEADDSIINIDPSGINVEEIEIVATGITSLDVAHMDALNILYLGYNEFVTAPDTSDNDALQYYAINNNALTTPPDVSSNLALLELNISVNALTTASVVTANTLLQEYDFSGNVGITVHPNIASNTALLSYRCSGCALTDLPSFAPHTLINAIDARNNGISTAEIDAMFNEVDAHNTSAGEIKVEGGTNGAPSGASSAARAALALRGWTITTN
jgi:hypothetical protein